MMTCPNKQYDFNFAEHLDNKSKAANGTDVFVFVGSAGREHNFNMYNDTTSSSLGIPYDYGSMMHYSKTAFRNGSEPTIVTRIPAFSDVIGQRMEFSDSDLLKLNRLYGCSKTHRLLVVRHTHGVHETGCTAERFTAIQSSLTSA